MIKEGSTTEKRTSYQERHSFQLVIVGGGMAGTCCAIAAAREGLKVCLIQDRPVLGGNASSEVRLWILGATSHMGNNNRWAREGGVIDEILVENLYRNPEGNAVILDSILMEKVSLERNIKLLLNTVVYDLEKEGPDAIKNIRAFCSQNSTEYILEAAFFVDASGDGIVGFLAGAPFRMGAEKKEEFGELFAPDTQYGELLGHSLYFYSKDTGKPVRFVPPAFANREISKMPRFKTFNLREHGCRLWWVEYGGRTNTILESEEIKLELWKIVYGIWDHVKNSGSFADVENLTLEWVGTIPGKRESRRFDGDYMLIQQDVVEQRQHQDAVSFGGWALDLHPADGVYSNLPGCTQWHSKGVYQIPFRTMYSKSIKNLFLGGRLISASHVAFGSSRVMATCAHNAQAVAIAAKLCLDESLSPRDLLEPELMKSLQNRLILNGQYIPGLRLDLGEDLLGKAKLSVSSEFKLSRLPFDGPWKPLEFSSAQLIPFQKGKIPTITLAIRSGKETSISAQLRTSSRRGNFTPDTCLKEIRLDIQPGEQFYRLDFDVDISEDAYLFVCLMAHDAVELRHSESRVTGLVSVSNKYNKSVATSSVQLPPDGIGIDTFEFWVPERRPAGHNFAFELDEPLAVFGRENLGNGYFRPISQPNAWLASLADTNPSVVIEWQEIQDIREIRLYFDTDFDHPMESTLMGHPESEIPFCVKSFRVVGSDGELLFVEGNNHQSIRILRFEKPIREKSLTIAIDHPSPSIPAALFGIVCL